jgi:hypothetical protein
MTSGANSACPLPEAQAIVSTNIGELIATPEYETRLGYADGGNRILTLLVQSCAAEIAVNIRPAAGTHGDGKTAQRTQSKQIKLTVNR